MSIEQGIVVKIEDKYIWVESQIRSTCGNCVAENSCGTGLIGKLLAKPHRSKVLLNGQQVTIGDSVEYQLNDQVIVKSALMMYLFPIVMLIAGAIIVPFVTADSHLLNSEAASLIGMLLGLLFSAIVLQRHATKHAEDPNYHPVVKTNTIDNKIDSQQIK